MQKTHLIPTTCQQKKQNRRQQQRRKRQAIIGKPLFVILKRQKKHKENTIKWLSPLEKILRRNKSLRNYSRIEDNPQERKEKSEEDVVFLHSTSLHYSSLVKHSFSLCRKASHKAEEIAVALTEARWAESRSESKGPRLHRSGSPAGRRRNSSRKKTQQQASNL